MVWCFSSKSKQAMSQKKQMEIRKAQESLKNIQREHENIQMQQKITAQNIESQNDVKDEYKKKELQSQNRPSITLKIRQTTLSRFSTYDSPLLTTQPKPIEENNEINKESSNFQLMIDLKLHDKELFQQFIDYAKQNNKPLNRYEAQRFRYELKKKLDSKRLSAVKTVFSQLDSQICERDWVLEQEFSSDIIKTQKELLQLTYDICQAKKQLSDLLIKQINDSLSSDEISLIFNYKSLYLELKRQIEEIKVQKQYQENIYN